MKRRMAQGLVIAAGALLAAACMDLTSPSSSSDAALALSQAFVTLPAGFTLTNNSFAGDGTTGGAFMPRMDHGGRGHEGPMDDISGHGAMGGGLGPDFFGGIGFGRGFGRGPFGGEALHGNCSFSSSTGVATCTDTHDGLTINSTAIYKTAGGTAQSAPDSTTNVAAVTIDVSGTVTRRDSAVSRVHNTSSRSVSGLAVGSTQRTVNGVARGEESTTGKTDSGVVFTATRLVGDTTTALVIPVVSGKPTYPTAGKVVRQMKATVTLAGGSPTTKERREVITYDGSATATLVITTDGTTKTCKLPLPRGVPSCS
ncbi:MAG TPA: hypothetical protein VFC35_05685 [Gemmatimonadaceae bacterium]|nr:hypothetical protein [Gemmatimonadaceae bacterium]